MTEKPPAPAPAKVAIGCLGLVVIIGAIVFALSTCSDNKTPGALPDTSEITSPLAPDLTPAASPRARADLAALTEPGAPSERWKGLPRPALGMCELNSTDHDSLCVQSQTDFITKYWPNAWKGDYQAQRNTAFCYATGCNKAVSVNTIEACAWRAIIVTSGSPSVDASDAANLERECGRLTPTEKAAARARATRIDAQL